MSINKSIISGRLVRDAELRTTASGGEVLSFSVAVNERRKDAESGEWVDRPSFVDCTLFGKRASALAKHLAKGEKVVVEGKLRQSTWETQDGSKRSKLAIVVDEVELMAPKAAETAEPAPAEAEASSDYDEEEVPF